MHNRCGSAVVTSEASAAKLVFSEQRTSPGPHGPSRGMCPLPEEARLNGRQLCPSSVDRHIPRSTKKYAPSRGR